jgi:hypothetical protein
LDRAPNLRGDVALTVVTFDLPGAPLAEVRRMALPCDWREGQRNGRVLEGVCRKHLASDGGAAHGKLALDPLVTALRRQGARLVTLELNGFGRPVERAPEGWLVEPSDSETPFGPLKSTAYKFYSRSDDHTPAPFEIRIGGGWSPGRLAIPFALTSFVPPLATLWLRRRASCKAVAASRVHWMLTGFWIYWDTSVAITDVTSFAARMQIESVAREAVLLVPFGTFVVGLSMLDQDWGTSLGC